MKHELVLKDETPTSESTQTITGKQQRTRLFANDATRLKLKDVWWLLCAKVKGKYDACTTYTIRTWNIRNMNQGKLEIVKQEKVYPNIAVLGISELKWTGMGHFQLGSCKVFHSGNDKQQEMMWL